MNNTNVSQVLSESFTHGENSNRDDDFNQQMRNYIKEFIEH
jgi:hypothetical protein